jgi:hypothetical protein
MLRYLAAAILGFFLAGSDAVLAEDCAPHELCGKLGDDGMR